MAIAWYVLEEDVGEVLAAVGGEEMLDEAQN